MLERWEEKSMAKENFLFGGLSLICINKLAWAFLIRKCEKNKIGNHWHMIRLAESNNQLYQKRKEKRGDLRRRKGRQTVAQGLSGGPLLSIFNFHQAFLWLCFLSPPSESLPCERERNSRERERERA